MESQYRESAQRALVAGLENSFPPEDTRPILPPDLLNLNDAEMAKLFEPGQQNAVLMESYSYQDMQDIVSSNPDLINESFESLIQDLDELSQPEVSPPVISEENKLDSCVFFRDNTKPGIKFENFKEEPVHAQSIVSISSQNLLSSGTKCSFPNENFCVASVQKCSSYEAAFPSFIISEGKVKCEADANGEIEQRVVSTATSEATWPVCYDQTVSSSASSGTVHHTQSKNEGDEIVEILSTGTNYEGNGLISQSVLTTTSSLNSLSSTSIMQCSTLDLKAKNDSISRKLSCDSSSYLQNICEIKEQVFAVIGSILEKVETNIDHQSSTCKIKIEVPSDSSETHKRRLKCHTCDQVFTLATNLYHHQTSHSKLQIFCCDPCDLVFETKEELLGHNIKLHNYSNGYLCDVCSTKLPTYCEYLEHSGYHTKQEPFICGECNLKYCKFSSYCLHLSVHTAELLFKCIVCTSFFRSWDDLFSHQRFFHSPNIMLEEKTYLKEGNSFKCETCGKVFSKLRSMVMHKTAAHKARFNDKSKLCCATCRKSFASMKMLRDHAVAAHHRNPLSKKTNKKSVFKCGDCDKSFHSEAVYSRHVLTHQSKVRRSSLKAKFQIKVSSSSFREVKFLCEFCCEPFIRASDLRKHIESMHSSVKERVKNKCQPKKKRRLSLDSINFQSASASVDANIEQDLKDSIPVRQEFEVIQESNEVWVKVNNNMLRGIKAEGPHPKQLEDASKLLRERCVRNSVNDEAILHFCTQCSLSFKTIFELIQHKQLHPLPFLCPTCGLSYLIENDLINHSCVFLVKKKNLCHFCFFISLMICLYFLRNLINAYES